MSGIYLSHNEIETHATLFVPLSAAEYKTLCPGGEGFRPNPITVILEGNMIIFQPCTRLSTAASICDICECNDIHYRY